MNPKPAFLLKGLFLVLFFLQACSEGQHFSRLERMIRNSWPKNTPVVETWKEDLQPEDLRSLKAFLDQTSARLNQISPVQLSPPKQERYRQLKNRLQTSQIEADQLASNPALYNLPAKWKALLANPEIPLSSKMEQLALQIPLASAYYARARQKLHAPTEKWSRLAIEKHVLGIAFLNGELQDAVNQSTLDQVQKEKILQDLQTAKLAIKDYIAWCNSNRLDPPGSK